MEKLKIDALLSYIKEEFDKFKDTRAENSSYSMGDILQSGLVIFSLKDSSLLDYNNQIANRGGNLKRIYKIEKNETFNTLKNQGYHFKHNFGHGHKNLCTNFAFLMMLAFLIDQIQQLINETFQKALEKLGHKKYLWRDIRNYFTTLPIASMEKIYNIIIHGFQIEYLEINQSSG